MKILSVCYDDHANLMYNITEAMKVAGADARCCKRVRHPFNYPSQAPLANLHEMVKACRDADIVQVFHSYNEAALFSGNAKKVVWHTGTSYRLQVQQMNDFFNDRVALTMTDQTEFLKLGASNIHYLTSPITTAPIDKEVKRPYLIGHYPSNPAVKGSEEIIRIVNTFIEKNQGSFTFDYSAERVSHEANLRRVAACDIYIELFAPLQHGQEYGCFGLSALEAAAMGKIVLTQDMNKAEYRNTYGGKYGPFFLIPDEETFTRTLRILSTMQEDDLLWFQRNKREIALRNHSPRATGEKLMGLLREYC